MAEGVFKPRLVASRPSPLPNKRDGLFRSKTNCCSGKPCALSSTVSFVTRWRLQSSFPCGSRLCLYTLAASRLLFGLSCTSLPSASPSWDGREERRVAGELERQGGRALLCVCPAVGRVDEVRGLPTSMHHLASLGMVTFPGMLVSDLFGPC